ncbi:MAG: tRNA threonylcarbamoyladenosine biosynthesis protein TsaB [Rhodothermales bacterium]
MKLLAIETATESCSVALAIDGQIRSRESMQIRGHAELLLPWIEELLAEGELALSGLDALVFSRGPGSFTSLRIGIGVTQGLAWGADIPVVPVSSLQSTAQAVVDRGVSSAIVALDARMNEVYCGTFKIDTSGLMQPVSEEMVCAPEAVTKFECEGWVGLGMGFERYPQLAEYSRNLSAVYPDSWPDAKAMIPLALAWLERHAPLPAEQVQAVYLRDKVAQKPA